mgnify:CR=1 FL=1
MMWCGRWTISVDGDARPDAALSDSSDGDRSAQGYSVMSGPRRRHLGSPSSAVFFCGSCMLVKLKPPAQATDADGNPLTGMGIDSASIASADAKNALERIESKDEHDDEDDNILGRIADLESKLESFHAENESEGVQKGAGAGAADAKGESKDDRVDSGKAGEDDDEASVMSGVTLPDNIGSELPTAQPSPAATPIQTPLFKARKKLGEEKEAGDGAKAEVK